MKTGEWLRRAEERLIAARVGSARLDSLILLEHATGQDRSWLLAHTEEELPAQALKQLQTNLKRRSKREPLAYLTGYKDFYDLAFKVTRAVLIPRPETETMVSSAVELAPKHGRVLDIGTGSGCVAVSLKHERRDVEVTATDVSPSALAVARLNAKRHDAAIKFIKSDLFSNVSGRYDVVLANLPYVPSGTRRQPELAYEPALALYAGADGLDFYRRFIARLGDYLTLDGRALIEAGPTQRAELARLAGAAGFDLSNVSEYVFMLASPNSRPRTGAGL